MHAECFPPNPRALIVEDEFLIAEELRERLSRLGFTVIGSVDTADEGIAIATRERPELVLMDIRLRGEKDGVQAAEEIRKKVDVSIVYVSAHSDRQTVDRAKTTDHDGFILKPFHRRDLQSTIEVAMLRRAARQEEREH
jgi:DNA-binding NarL/FixJ family response regulator